MSNEPNSKKNRPHPTNTAGFNPKNTSNKPTVFIEGYLDERDRDWLDSNADSQYELILEFLAGLPPGLKLGLGYEERSERYKATLTCSIEGHADNNKVLSSRAATPTAALFALYYRHNVKYKDGWGQAKASSSLYD